MNFAPPSQYDEVQLCFADACCIRYSDLLVEYFERFKQTTIPEGKGMHRKHIIACHTHDVTTPYYNVGLVGLV